MLENNRQSVRTEHMMTEDKGSFRKDEYKKSLQVFDKGNIVLPIVVNSKKGKGTRQHPANSFQEVNQAKVEVRILYFFATTFSLDDLTKLFSQF